VISDPRGVNKTINVPPAGFIAGIYAHTDVQRGVHKTPANTPVLGALRFAQEINQFQQELLNPSGINCLRSFPGRGHQVWGGRTLSDDPEWKYVNVRRYFLYLERSIEKSTQWAVFEPNGERLWENVRNTVDGFLFNEWRNGRLLGSEKTAWFVRCDRSTMTQNDLDNGRLICEVGVAALKPAEFVVFRIGQKTADS
jgi:phage tail sheath protein FI